MNIHEALAAFEAAMLAKFAAVDHKHGKPSIFEVATGAGFDRASLVAHLQNEIVEWLHAPESVTELVDVANMAFLLWWAYQDTEAGE